MTITGRTRLLTVLGAAVTLLVLAGCGEDDGTSAPGTAQADAVTVSDAWVKAVDEGMTAAFGVLSNGGDAEVTLVSATTPAAAMVEIHEVVMGAGGDMVMQPKEGGVMVAPGSSATLEPGGDHLMLMDVDAAIEPGDEVTLTLEFADGSTLQVTATAKEFTGGNEEYVPDEG